MIFKCEICNEEITNLKEALFVRIENEKEDKLDRIACVHKGECDTKLEACLRGTVFSTNTYNQLSEFDTDEERFYYFNTGDKLVNLDED